MSSVLIVTPKKVPWQKMMKFFALIDNIAHGQRWEILSNMPRVYFHRQPVTTTEIKGFIKLIKNAPDFSVCVSDINYSPTMIKG